MVSMPTDLPRNPMDAETLPDLIRRQLAVYSPHATVHAIARGINVPPSTLAAYCVDEGPSARTPEPAMIKALIPAIGGDEALVSRALSLWAAAKGAA